MRFREFWPMYLKAHRRPMTRAMHYAATVVGFSATAVALASGQYWLAFGGIAAAYAIAVVSHWVFEGNQPLITVNALWGAVSDIRMCWLAVTGRLKAEFLRQGIDRRAVAEKAVAVDIVVDKVVASGAR